MKPDEIQALSAIAQSILACVSIVASVAVALFVYFGTKKLAKAQFFQTLATSWNTIDSTLLLSDQNLAVANSLLHDHEKAISEADLPRKRWIAYMLLNPIETAFAGVRKGFLDKQLMKNIERTLRSLLADDEVFRISQEGIYQPQFVEFCRDVRGKIAGLNPMEGTGVTAVSNDSALIAGSTA